MNYVYMLQSLSHPDQFYTGPCKDVEVRFAAHNAGQSPHTSKFKPWRLLSYHCWRSGVISCRTSGHFSGFGAASMGSR